MALLPVTWKTPSAGGNEARGHREAGEETEQGTHTHTPLKVVLESVDLVGHWGSAAIFSYRNQ